MYENLVRNLLGLTNPEPKPVPVFRPKTWDEMFGDKGVPRGGAASLTPIMEPGSVAAMNAEADAAAAANANPPGFTPQWGVPVKPLFSLPTNPLRLRLFPTPGNPALQASAAQQGFGSRTPGERAMDRLNAASPGLLNPPTDRAAGTGQPGFGTPSPAPGTVMEHMLERGVPVPFSGPTWNQVPVTPTAPPVASQPPIGIDTTTGASFRDRAALGLLIKPKGKVSYLTNRYGAGNADYDPAGRLMFRPTDTSQWTLVDEEGPGWGDIADFSGDAIEFGPTLAGGVLGGGVPGAIAGAAVGNALRQAAGGLLPGETGMSMGEGALRVGVSGLTAGAGKKVWDAGRVMPWLRKIQADIPKSPGPAVHAPLTSGQLAILDAAAERAYGGGVSIGTGTVLDKIFNNPETHRSDGQPQGPSPYRRRLPGP